MRFHLSLRLPDDAAYIPVLRHLCREALAAFGVEAEDLDDLELLVGELAANAVRHARCSFCRVDLELYHALTVFTVADARAGFQRAAVPLSGAQRADSLAEGDGTAERFGGWGLPLVETLSDEVEYLEGNPRGSVVRARRHFTSARDGSLGSGRE